MEQEISMRSALTKVLREELQASELTVLLGETVRGGGAAGITLGLYEAVGPKQVIETPVSENGFFGAALGLAIAGCRPIVEIYAADFLLAVANEVMNDMAKWRQQHQLEDLPITIRGCMGANGGLGPEHSQCMEAYLHHAPGLSIVVPGTPMDAAGLLRSAIRSNGPVVFLEHRRLYDVVGPVPADPDFVVPMGTATVVQSGDDLTMVAWGWMRQEAETAAGILHSRGVSVEIVDPRTIRPMDWATLQDSVHRTGRLVIVEESQRTGSVGAEIIARLTEATRKAFRAFRVCMPDVIHPYSPTMESQVLPNADVIASAVMDLID